MENKSGWRMIDDIKDLPTMPVIYFKVNQMLQTGEASVKNVATLIEMDPAMSSKVLQLVNCAFYGFRSQISSIPHAVMILGFNAVKNAIVSVSILDVLTIKEKFQNFNINDFWSHSLSVAVLSKQLAERSRLVTPEDAFTAGLLHDMGKIIMLKYFQEDLAVILRTKQENESSFYDAELKAAAVGHVQIGAYLAKKWQFPDSIVESIACHHMRIKKSGISGMVPCIILADALSNGQYQINPDDFIFSEEVERIIKPIVMNIKSWLAEAQAEIDMACEFFLKGRP
jgi:putative nucleotidyltransferase with HDIG domain